MIGWERLRWQIPDAVLAEIRAFHHDRDFDCAAHSEGQTCCLDLLAGSDTVDVDAPTTTKDGS